MSTSGNCFVGIVLYTFVYRRYTQWLLCVRCWSLVNTSLSSSSPPSLPVSFPLFFLPFTHPLSHSGTLTHTHTHKHTHTHTHTHSKSKFITIHNGINTHMHTHTHTHTHRLLWTNQPFKRPSVTLAVQKYAAAASSSYSLWGPWRQI